MTYQDVLETALLDEMQKIAALPASLAGLAARSVLGAPLKTWGKRALIGAAPGALVGAATAQPGEGIGGAVKGGLVGAGAGMLGGGLLQHRALTKVPGYASGLKGKSLVKAVKGAGGLEKLRALRQQAVPGL